MCFKDLNFIVNYKSMFLNLTLLLLLQSFYPQDYLNRHIRNNGTLIKNFFLVYVIGTRVLGIQ